MSEAIYDGKTALQLALDNNDRLMVYILLDNGADAGQVWHQLIRYVEGRSDRELMDVILRQSIEQKKYEILETFMDSASAEVSDKKILKKLLAIAIQTENTDAVEMMLKYPVIKEAGCLTRAISDEGLTALVLANVTGNPRIIKAVQDCIPRRKPRAKP